jgi:hypothetical protein
MTTIRVHIERLVVDPRTLAPQQVPRFRAELTEALGRLHSPPAEPVPRPRDTVARLAERTAQTILQNVPIHQRVARR